MMTDQVASVVEPFVRRGLFATPEKAVIEMARDYIMHQIEHYRSITENLQAKYGMTYEQFVAYLKFRSRTLETKPDPALSEAVMKEEEDALDWKIATEMLQSWLGLQAEVGQ